MKLDDLRTRARALWTRTRAILGVPGRAIRWLHVRHGAFAILVATAALIVTTWQVVEARQASSREIGLFRDQLGLAQGQLELAESQYASTSRPIIVPVPDPDPETPFASTKEGVTTFQFKLKNATTVPALSGSVYLVPPDANDDPCPPDFETSSVNQPAYVVMPSISSGETVTLEVADLPFQFTTDMAALCVGAQYTDPTGAEWMTEWQFQKYVNQATGESDPRRWDPQAIRTCRLVENPQYPPTHLFISCVFHAAD